MNKKILFSLLFGILLVGTVFVSAQTINATNYPADNVLGRIISWIDYNVLKQGGYTVYGQTLKCTTQPVYVGTWSNSFLGGSMIQIHSFENPNPGIEEIRGISDTQVLTGSSTAFVDVYRGANQGQFIGEYWVGDGNRVSLTCDAGDYWNKQCSYEVYSCPAPCYSDSDCSSLGAGATCDKSTLSQKIPNAGVCTTPQNQAQLQNQTTNVYKCSNGQKTFLKTVSLGDPNFCPTKGDNNYVLDNGGVDGSCYPTSQEPLICSQVPKIDVQVSIKATDIKSTTTKDLLKSECTSSEVCNNNGTCTNLASLKDKGYIDASKATDIVDTTAGLVASTATGAVVAGAVCTGLVATGTVVTAGATAWILPLCGVVGGSVGFLGDSFVTSIFQNAKDKNDQTLGICILPDNTNFFGTISNALNLHLTNDPNTDGMIIVFGGLLLLIIFVRLLG